MQYQVPQFVDMEDRIIGPLTLKQFLYLASGGGLLLINWFLFTFFLWFLLAIPIVALAAAFAFLKINGQSFIYFLASIVAYFFKPRLYIWNRKGELKSEEASASGAKSKITETPPAEEKLSRSKLKELALNLDVAARRKVN